MLGFFIGLIIGAILGYTILYLVVKYFPKDNIEYSRTGLYEVTWNCTRNDGFSGKVKIQYEVGELNLVDDMSKIEVISLKADRQRFNTKEETKTFKDLVNQSWVKSSDIKWAVQDLAQIRGAKIDKILNSK